MPLRPCLTCGLATSATRCPPCARGYEQGRRPSWRGRGYDSEYDRNRRLLLATNPACVYCGAPATTADHITPRSKGGGNGMGNLAPACARCNYGRGNRPTTPRP